jgi:hypothetical protein
MEHIAPLDLVQVIFWFMAGCISFYFSIGNARVWTSISLGFFLIFISQAYLLAPWADYPQLEAIHYIIGTIAIMVMTHGFQEYYVFTRTFEVGGSKLAVYLGTAGVVAASALFIAINPEPQYTTLRHIKMIENTSWVFLSLINVDMIRKIHHQIRDSVVAKGFVAFMVVFGFIFLWKGSELYLQVFCWDNDWRIFASNNGIKDTIELYSSRVALSRQVDQIAGMLSGISVGATFVYLYRLLK